MVGFRSVPVTLVLATALVSRPLGAQNGYATAVHTVSVTVPPRVKTQVSSFSVSTLSSQPITAGKPVRGVAVRVTATQPWILSIGAAKKSAPTVKWSRTQHTGYSSISVNQAKVAAAARGTTTTDATLFLSSDVETTADAPVLLTMAAQ